MKNFKGIIFDFYGVICSEIGSPWYKNHFSTGVGLELKTRYDRPSNLGDISEKEFFERIGEAANLSGETVRKEWTDTVVINDELVSFIKKLKETYKTAICSNTQPKLFRQILDENSLAELFDVIVSSSEVRLIKPDPEIFEYTLSQLEIPPQQAIYTDDREDNIEAARNMGITSLLYVDVATLKRELGELLK